MAEFKYSLPERGYGTNVNPARKKKPVFGSMEWQDNVLAEINRKLEAGEYLTKSEESFLDTMTISHPEFRDWRRGVKRGQMVAIATGQRRLIGSPLRNPPDPRNVPAGWYDRLAADFKMGTLNDEQVQFLDEGGYKMGGKNWREVYKDLTVNRTIRRGAKVGSARTNPHKGRNKRYSVVVRDLNGNQPRVVAGGLTLGHARQTYAMNQRGIPAANWQFNIEQEPIHGDYRDAAGHYLENPPQLKQEWLNDLLARVASKTVLGGLPEGHFYAMHMGEMSLEQFHLLRDICVRNGFITVNGHLMKPTKKLLDILKD
jgi:hypothetical protein